jgi:hypothetical protein
MTHVRLALDSRVLVYPGARGTRDLGTGHRRSLIPRIKERRDRYRAEIIDPSGLPAPRPPTCCPRGPRATRLFILRVIAKGAQAQASRDSGGPHGSAPKIKGPRSPESEIEVEAERKVEGARPRILMRRLRRGTNCRRASALGPISEPIPADAHRGITLLPPAAEN